MNCHGLADVREGGVLTPEGDRRNRAFPTRGIGRREILTLRYALTGVWPVRNTHWCFCVWPHFSLEIMLSIKSSLPTWAASTDTMLACRVRALESPCSMDSLV